VVLTHNRPAELLRTLSRLRALPERPEIVVVDNASREPVAPLIDARFPGVRCVTLPLNAGAAGRNAGVRACARRYVALCDDDTWWEPGSLRHAADLLDAHPSVAVLNATVMVGEENRVDPTCRVMENSPLQRSPELPGAPLLGFMAGASIVRRDAFLAVGGFAPRLFLGGEERLLAIDLARRG
jgi:GT2 family glycosyltransferase